MPRRLFDLGLALPLAVLLAPLIAALALIVLVVDGGPVFFLQKRMCRPDRAFRMVKFRTMRPEPDDDGVCGGNKQARITRLGRFLRHSRLDELPQIWHVVTGDMALVGPRPPLPRHVAAEPALFAALLQRSRPGLTGFATLALHKREARLLARCTTTAEAEAVYSRRCLGWKLRLDLAYEARRSIGSDLALIWRSLQAVARTLGPSLSPSFGGGPTPDVARGFGGPAPPPSTAFGPLEWAGPLAGALAGCFAGRVVLVTGAGGSIGSELCRQILALGPARLVMVDHSEFALYEVERRLRPQAEACSVKLVAALGSVTDEPFLRRLFAEATIDIVLHAAAYKHVPMVEANPVAGLAVNVLGTALLAQRAQEAGVRRFILISTDKAVRPASAMGASKRLAELLVQDAAAQAPADSAFSILRFGNVAGSSGSVVPLFAEQIAQGGPVTVTALQARRYFMSITEAVGLVLTATALANGGEVFVLDMGAPVEIGALARQMILAAGRRPRLAGACQPEQADDIEIREIGLRPGEKLCEELLINPNTSPTAHPRIRHAQEPQLPPEAMVTMLRQIRQVVARDHPPEALALLRHWAHHAPTSIAPLGDQARTGNPDKSVLDQGMARMG